MKKLFIVFFNKKPAMLCFISLITYFSSLISINAQNVGINSNGSKPDASAGLDVNFPDKGFLMPRVALKSLTDVTTIPNPASGLMVYNSNTQCIEYFTGSAWQNIVCPCTGAPSTPGVINGYPAPCISSAGNVYTIAAVSGANSYTWSVPTGATITAGAGTTSITVTFGATSGTVSVTAVNSCGTSGASTLPVTLNSIPATPSVPSGTTTPVISASSVYTISPVTGATSYAWSVSTTNGSVSSGQGTTSATINFSSTPATMNICVTANDTCGNSAPACLSVTSTSCVHGSQTFNVNGSSDSTGTIQTFTVSNCVTSITIVAVGGGGGSNTYSGTNAGGLGAQMQGVFVVTPGEVLKILVGEAGQGGAYSCAGGGGGGGSFVTDNSNNPLIVAGGGGGASLTASVPSIMNASTGTSGNNGTTNGGGNGMGYGGTGGDGSTTWASSGSGCGGGGLLTNGGSGTDGPHGGYAFVNGGGGGCQCRGGAGGFGGGGSGRHVGGGGGGYSGGGSGGYTSSCQSCGGGGGGGSYNGGTNQINTAGVEAGNGQVVITW